MIGSTIEFEQHMIRPCGLIAWILLLAIGGGRTMAQPPTPSDVFREVGIDQKLNGQVPLDLPFRDEHDRRVTLREYFRGKPVVISLVYYACPMLCTQVLNGMVETFKTLGFSVGDEFDVITVSIDPSESSALALEKKESYLSSYGRSGAAEGWHFLTGDSASISGLASAVGFKYVYDSASRQFAHGAGIMIATPEGKLARYLYGIEYPAKDLRFSLMEASRGRIGSPVDKLLLLCYHYDPSTGKYGVLVMTLVRIAGGTFVFLLGGYMLYHFRQDRKKRVMSSQPTPAG